MIYLLFKHKANFMKQVFNTNEVAHIWAQQSQDAGRNSGGNFYFEGATIYSYGGHFPIATIEGNNVLFTLRGYSNTTAKHIGKARGAVSHKNVIYCYDVPVKYQSDKKPLNKQSFTGTHENNFNQWKDNIKRLFAELGNKKNRNTEGRIREINTNVSELSAYASYFGLKIKDSELKSLLSIVSAPDFVDQAREAKVKQDAANEKRLKQAEKAHNNYIDLWRKYDTEGIKNMPDKVKALINYYTNNQQSFTRLRLNKAENRLETSKGVQIPADIAKRAYKALNGCMEGSCNNLAIPVLSYTITETGKDYIKAGCHTIPKDDVRYIAELLNW